MHASLNDTGRAAVVLDTGAASRGSGNAGSNKEKTVRQWFVDHDRIEAVLYLPENLFYNTTAPGIVLFLNKAKPKARQGKVLLVNASQVFEKGDPKNFIPDDRHRPDRRYDQKLEGRRQAQPHRRSRRTEKERLQHFAEPLHPHLGGRNLPADCGDRCGAGSHRGREPGDGRPAEEDSAEDRDMSELILYTSDDGRTRLDLRVDGQTVWLTQLEIAELFQTTKQNVSLHAKNIFKDGELARGFSCQGFLDNCRGRQALQHQLYNLDLILAIGYRVRSPRGVQFRQWASTHLKEYLVKGFVMDDERLKNPGGWDYFDELLARIREIRASEKRFYQKIRDLFALSTDYRPDDQDAQLFFAEVQNKLLYAVTRHTAAEIVVARADPAAAQHGAHHLERFPRPQARRHHRQELPHGRRNRYPQPPRRDLPRTGRTPRQGTQDLTLDYWRQNVDRLLEFNERPVLDGAGTISHEAMKQIARDRYETFDEHRRSEEARQADAEDLQELEAIAKELEQGGE